ncbi:MAG: OmpA family protein [Treponema sp.]|nr:OmpA family protein [Treponema sp.]
MKLLKKIMITSLLLSSVIITNVFADDADHSKLLPDFSNIAFDYHNIYFGLEVPFALPLGFTGDQKIAGNGLGIALEAGYDWDGWLAGFHTEWRRNLDNGNLMYYFDNIFINLEISKLFGSSIIPFMPDFLDLRATFGIGADIINTEFYPNESYKSDKQLVNAKGFALDYNFGAEIEYNDFEKFIPYLGLDVNLSGDKSGTFVNSSVNVGVRTTIRKIVGPALVGNPGLSIKTKPDFFTPDGDGKDDELTFKIKTKYAEGAEPKSWKVEIIEDIGGKSSTIKTYSGEGMPPKSLVWNGESDKKDFSPVSASEYKVLVTVEDSLGNVNTQETTANIGILVEKMSDGSLRILVNSIKFDANKATFDSLSAKDKRSNENTIKMIANALKKYKQYNVIIEGHAHNISGTQEEENTELIPLSKDRADAIKAILVEEGVNEAILSAVGKGGKEPISKEPAKNRRVEFKLVTTTLVK